MSNMAVNIEASKRVIEIRQSKMPLDWVIYNNLRKTAVRYHMDRGTGKVVYERVPYDFRFEEMSKGDNC